MLAMIAYDSFTWGLVTWKFWMWFVLPVFPTLPLITFLQAVGLSMFIGLFKNQISQQVKKEYVDQSSTLTLTLLIPWLVLICGWIIKLIIY